jgi:hypothetical protein
MHIKYFVIGFNDVAVGILANDLPIITESLREKSCSPPQRCIRFKPNHVTYVKAAPVPVIAL